MNNDHLSYCQLIHAALSLAGLMPDEKGTVEKLDERVTSLYHQYAPRRKEITKILDELQDEYIYYSEFPG